VLVVRFRRFVKSTRLTAFGAVLLVGAGVTAGLGPRSAQPTAFLVLVIAALVLVGGGLSGGSRARHTGKGLAKRRAEFGPRPRNVSGETAAEASEDAWRRERERREQNGRT
jgi:hypothetical protein